MRLLFRLGFLSFMCVSISFTAINPAQGQANFLNGFIVSAESDTIRGQVDYQNWSKNPDFIDFKSEGSAEIQSFTHLQILGFGVADEYYVSAWVDVETSPRAVSDLQESSKLNLKPVSVFLQAVIMGSKALYHYKDASAGDHFYLQNGSRYDLLEYKRYLPGRFVKERKTYMNQLLRYLSDCEAISEKIRKTPYNKRSLEKLFVQYYNCSGEQIQFRKESEGLGLKLGLVAGVSHSRLNFAGDVDNFLINTDFAGSTRPALGFSAEVYFARNSGRWSIMNEVLYVSYTARGQVTEVNPNNFASIYHDSELGMNYIKVNHLLRYNRKLRNLTFFINGGFSNGFSVSTTNELSKEITLFNSTRVEEGPVIDEIRTYEQGLLFGAGLAKGNISGELRFESGNGMYNKGAVGARSRKFLLLFSLPLEKGECLC